MYGIFTNIYRQNQLNIGKYAMDGMGNVYLGGGFKHISFSPLPGEMIQFD